MAARPDTWMPIYWGDYARDTGHLSAAHHGAYLMLIKHYWTTGGLPDDDAQLWRIACADSLAHWRKLKAVVGPLFEQRDGQLFHKRIEAELTGAVHITEERSKAGARGAAKRWEGHNKKTARPMANASQSDGPSPSQSQEEVTTAGTVGSRTHTGDIEPPDHPGFEEPDTPQPVPKFLAQHGVVAPRAQTISPDWLPSESAQRELVKSRKDLTPERIQQEMVAFRRWCAASNVTSHNPDATWLKFMEKTHVKRTSEDDLGSSPTSRAIDAAFARRHISTR